MDSLFPSFSPALSCSVCRMFSYSSVSFLNVVCLPCWKRGSGNRGYVVMSLPLQNTPPTVELSGKLSVNMSEFRSGNSKTGHKKNNYLFKSTTVGLDSNPHNMDIDIWPEFRFPDIY